MTTAFRGLLVALATPFRRDGSLDLDAFAKLVGHVRSGGADALVALGSTGEATALADGERDEVVAACLAAAGKTPVVVGCTASATAQAGAFAARAQQLGAAGALIAVPPYCKPSQAGIVAHFAAIAIVAPGLPIIAYNVPSRSGVNLLPATLRELWQLPTVVALKESSGNLQQIAQIAAELPAGKHLLAGDDPLALPTLSLGAHGLVSVTGNLVPAMCRELVARARAGELVPARELHARLLPLSEALMGEPNPSPLKAALQSLGIGTDHVRLPLLPASAALRDRLRTALAAAEPR